jgi:dTDP-4-dehydrorhamnose reductase
MRIMITGGKGQVGGALVKALEPSAVVVAVNRDELDLVRPDQVPSALDRMAPDLIINAAAYTAVDRAEDEKDVAFRINAESPAAMARWAASRGVPLIHFSTDYVFDGAGTRPWREDDPTNPLSVYGASKLAGDQAIRSTGGPHLIARTSWVYAARGTNFLRAIARYAKERRQLRIVADQVGAPTSARLIADVVASIISKASTALVDYFSVSGGLINVAASGETSWYGFAAAIVRGLQQRGVTLTVEEIVPITAAEYPTKAKRPQNSRLDLTRLNEAFGIRAPHWHSALTEELDELARELA